MMTRFNRNLRLGYGFSILILLVVGLASYITLQSLLASNKMVEHSGQVMQKFEKVLSVMTDAETGQRGYLLSGKTDYLEPYNGAYQRALHLTDELARLTADNPRQQQNISSVKRVLHQRLAILRQLVEKKQRGEAITVTDLDNGKSAMDALRTEVARGERDEQELQKIRTDKLNHYTSLVPALILIAALVAIGIAAYSYRNVIQDYREKERLRMELEASEKETQALNEELTAANEEIIASNEELSATNEELLEARDQLTEANEMLEQRVMERTKALQDSEEETQALNEELTAINEELLSTNEELVENERRLRELIDELRIADERSAKLAAIVESSDDAIIAKDLDGIVTAWNRGAERIFAYTEQEIVGQSILKLIPEDLQHEEPLILARLRNGEKLDHYETMRRTADGRLIPVSLTISPIRDKEGRVIGASKIARDITEQTQDEQRKSDFIGMASHELKTPLTTLTSLVQMLEKKLKDNNDPFVPLALSKASLQTKKMINLINGFLNISRLESGKLEISKESLDLTAMIAEQLDEIRLTVTTHTFHFEESEQITVIADHDKISSVISNLLSNAVKYSPGGKVVHVRLLLQTGKVQVSIQDEGLGIRPQDMPHIFERYYRAGTEHTRQISGFGVGLYLSAEIIERHDGKIWVESENGVGSTFFFTLPLS